MVSWKDLFEKTKAELDLTKRKKQALDDLHRSGRISQFAYECLNKELTEEIEQSEARRKALAEKMTRKLNELDEQRIALEMFLANTEMSYVAGEIDDELYAKESNALDLGLEATKHELNWIREVIIQLIPKESEPANTPATTPTESAEATIMETSIEKTTETASNVSVEVPVEVTTTSSEAKVEPVQPPAEAPATPPATTSEGAEAPFRDQGRDKPA